MQVHRLGLPVAVALAAAAVGVATFALRPREGQIEPAEVEPRAYFSEAELDRAHDFRRPQRVIALTNLALSGAVLALIALRPPRRARDALARGRPYRTAAAAGAGISRGAGAGDAAAGRGRARTGAGRGAGDAGLGRLAGRRGQGPRRSPRCSPPAGAMLLLWLLRRFPRRWWSAGAGAVVAISVLFAYVSPIVLDPIFNKFEPLPEGRLRSDVARPGRALRRRRGRGLPDRRQPPHDRRSTPT